MTHWESSKRPLFLKTIWQDGQHHVLLHQEDDEHNLSLSSRSKFNRQVKSAVVSGCQTKNLNVSSVKLLISVSKDAEINSATKKCALKRYKTSVKHQQPSICNDYLFVRAQTNTNSNLSIKSNSIDISDIRPYTSDAVLNHLTYNHYLESYYNSLSERVLVWLDLATQKGNYSKQLKIESQSFRTQSFSNNMTPTFLPRQQRLDSNRNTFCVQGVSTSSQHSATTPLPQDESPSSDIIEDILLSSEIEENVSIETMAENDDKLRCKGATVKRQLHIFMPNNLPKKISNCDSSNLSSKMSNASSTYTNRSKTIQVVYK